MQEWNLGAHKETAIENPLYPAAEGVHAFWRAITITRPTRLWRSFSIVATGYHHFDRWSWAVLVRSGALLLGLALVGFTWARLSNGLSPTDFAALVLRQGAWGPWLFLGLASLTVAVGLPRQAVAFAGAYCFGFWTGFALGLAASVVSAALGFGWARGVGRTTVQRVIAGRLARIDRFLGENPFHASLVLRLLPIGNNVLINIVAGISGMSAIRFLLGSAIGYIPQTIIFALVGTGTRLGLASELGLTIGLFAASAVLGLALLRRHVGPLARFCLGKQISAAKSDDPDSESGPPG